MYFYRWNAVSMILIATLTAPVFANPCETLISPQDIIDCALVNHPEMRVAQAGVDAAQSLDSVAKQRPNPEVNSQTVWASTYGKPYFYTEYNFAHTFELGGKRSSRIENAKAELRREEAGKIGTKEKVYLETLLALFRLRQLKIEISTVEDALESFSRIQRQYRSRPRLSPEQRANLTLFELAGNDYRMRLIPLEAEVDYHLKRLEIALGREFVPSPDSLPKFRREWPSLPGSGSYETLAGAGIKLAEADLKLATTQLSLAKSTAWPDFKIGPTYENQSSIGQNFNAYGFNFVLPLPLYQRNEAGRAYANLAIKRNEIALEATRKEGLEEREYYGHKYSRAVTALKTSPSEADMSKKHEEVEGLFNRGLIPGNLVIELHRQVHDFTKTYNAQELAAVEAITRVYMLEGKLPEDITW